ncbi:MAG TPA: 3-hydroxybutyryl-CoA dehydrogenase [Segeticoccus sp.]|nr:3-hydroxybutyryl-CoA dehydrogenase [Segeticoccus sp.]
MVDQVNSVGVVGLGTMGAGIVEVFARSGITVIGADSTPELAERGRGFLEKSTRRALDRGKLAEADRDALLGRASFTHQLSDLADVDLVVEAVPEKLELKRQVFTRLDGIVGPGAVLATNTSSLSVTEIAAATSRPERVVGMHFFNPAPVLKLVEVIRTVVADDAAVEAVRDLAVRLGKKPVVVGDQAGFIANALLFGYLNRAIAMLQERFATREDIDAAMTVGAGLPMGPFTLADLVGLDVALEISEVMFAHHRDPLHAPHPLLQQLVTAGRAGRKSGQGFYTYDRPGSGTVVADQLTPAEPDAQLPDSLVVLGQGAGADELARLLPAQDLRPLDLDAVGDGEAVDADLVLVADTGAPLGAVAARVGRPESVVGVRLHGPTKRGRLAELVRGVLTSEESLAAARSLLRTADLVPVVSGDRAGRIVDGLVHPYLNDAAKMVEAHYAGPDDIDTAMTAGCGYPVGPIAQLDQVGLEHALSVERAIYAETRQPGLAPAPLLQQLVTVGRGFRTDG